MNKLFKQARLSHIVCDDEVGNIFVNIPLIERGLDNDWDKDVVGEWLSEAVWVDMKLPDDAHAKFHIRCVWPETRAGGLGVYTHYDRAPAIRPSAQAISRYERVIFHWMPLFDHRDGRILWAWAAGLPLRHMGHVVVLSKDGVRKIIQKSLKKILTKELNLNHIQKK